MLTKFIKISAVAALITGLAACSKVTHENYQMLSVGMDKAEVEGIIGAPSSCSETLGAESCLWGNEEGKNITVKFIGGKTILFNQNGLDE